MPKNRSRQFDRFLGGRASQHGLAVLAACVAILLCLGCGEEEPGEAEAREGDRRVSAEDAANADAQPQVMPFRFTDVTDQSGIDVILTSGETPSTELLEVKKGGLALIDYNNNGRLDLFVANGATMDDPETGPGWRLYENLGDLRFRDVTEQAGIAHTRWAMGACVADVTGNGYDDIYITCYGPNVLLRNNGDGTFTDITEEAGVADDRWGTTCAFGDLRGDGKLDLYVANYMVFDHENPPPRATHKGVEVMGGPFGIEPEHDVLYRNNGDGTFSDVTDEAAVRPDIPAYGLNVAILDFTGDGRQDIYVGNDSTPNFLFVNQGEGMFVDRAVHMGIATNIDGFTQATMGVAIGDVNANGFPDVFTTNFANDTNTLHVNLDGRFFEDQTRRRGLGLVSRPYLGWAAEFIDLNHDGREELFFVNGHIYPQATMELMDSEYEQPPMLFRRTGERYERVTDPAVGDWLFRNGLYRAALFADLNGNGALDLIFGEINRPVRVLRNDGATGNWLIVELRDDRDGVMNRHGLGSRLRASGGEKIWTRWIYSGASYQSSRAPSAHFGFPNGVESVSVTITWPDGSEQVIEEISLNQRITIERE